MHLLKNNRVEKFLSASTMEERTLAACIMLIELLNNAHAIHSCDLTHGFVSRPKNLLSFSSFSESVFVRCLDSSDQRQSLLRMVNFCFLRSAELHSSKEPLAPHSNTAICSIALISFDSPLLVILRSHLAQLLQCFLRA
jgi:hypothetical protein